MEWLQNVVANAEVKEGKLDADSLVTAIKAELPKHTMPKSEYNNINTLLKEANKTIETLKTDNKDNESLQSKITEHETTITNLKADHAKELLAFKKDAAIKELLSSNNAKYPELLKDKFDLEKILINDDGTTTGLTEQLETVKNNYADMFADSNPVEITPPPYQYKPALGIKPTETKGKADFLSIIHENQVRK